MIKKNLPILTVCLSLFCFFFSFLQAGSMEENEVKISQKDSTIPKETVVLNLPKEAPSDWKEISCYLQASSGIIERIPKSQSVNNWSELIALQYYTHLNKKQSSLDTILSALRKATIDAYPGNQVTWNILERSDSDVIWEWILHKPYKNIPPQHEISRGFLTETGFYRVGYTKKFGEMDSKEKETWTQVLKDSSVVTMDKANDLPGLSLIKRSQWAFLLPEPFKNWKVNYRVDTPNVHSFKVLIPPSIVIPEKLDRDFIINESLDLEIVAVGKVYPMALLLQLDRQNITDRFGDKTYFKILKKNSNEVIFCFHYLFENLQATGIKRIFYSDSKELVYRATYSIGLDKKLDSQEIEKWKRVLESIQVTDRD